MGEGRKVKVIEEARQGEDEGIEEARKEGKVIGSEGKGYGIGKVEKKQ